MAMNLTRTGSAAVVGVASAVAEPPRLAAVNLGGQSVSWATILELLAVVGGAGVQFMAPYTLPNVVDGAIDGGIALLARRGTNLAMNQMNSAGSYMPTRIGGYSMPQLGPRTMGQIGSVGNVAKRKLV